MYILPYNHWNNPIEKCFYQLKTYIRRDEPKKIINLLIIFYAGKIILRLFFSPMSYEEIKKTIKKAIKNITKDNLYNYFKSSLEIVMFFFIIFMFFAILYYIGVFLHYIDYYKIFDYPIIYSITFVTSIILSIFIAYLLYSPYRLYPLSDR